jgi:uncharacterized membrane protein YdbT with pleckstrin-like domain
VFRKLKDDFEQLKRGEPGKRFIEHHKRHHQSEGKREATWKTAGYITVGLVFLIAGAALSLVPGIPGIVFGIPAIGLLVARLRTMAMFMDRSEVFVRRGWGKRRRG